MFQAVQRSGAQVKIPLSAPDITEAEIAAVTRVLRTPHLSLGPELTAFEQEFAAYHRVPHAVAVSSGTAGLHLALLTLGIGPGHEVILPAFTFVAVANAVLQVGAKPVLADIDATTLNLDPASVEEKITPRTRAIIAVHTFGIPADIDALLDIARRDNLFLIEDACEAIGAEWNSPVHSGRAGSFGHLAVFGFYPNKQITTGEGGMVLAHDPVHADRLRSLRNQGRLPGAGWLDHSEPGYNYRLSELACALGRVQLTRLHEILPLRASAAQCYNNLLAGVDDLILPPLAVSHRTLSWFVYVVQIPNSIARQTNGRARIRQALEEQGIATGLYFPPLHRQPALGASVGGSGFHLPVTESVSSRTLALPFFTRITTETQSFVAQALLAALQTK
ncbi:MAG: DegT/DnrJ/EryC1/StrS family aminotransferase [Acidobacteriota bacterium]|nr:DegT/DnrJ/EryC1/StrS family aminotransferase [Acidobacteriota bacterium]